MVAEYLFDDMNTAPPHCRSLREPQAAARRTDPASSHAAADEHEKSGKAATHRARLENAVYANPGKTSKELAEIAGLERHEAARRLPEIERMGGVRRQENGKAETTWFPREAR